MTPTFDDEGLRFFFRYDPKTKTGFLSGGDLCGEEVALEDGFLPLSYCFINAPMHAWLTGCMHDVGLTFRSPNFLGALEEALKLQGLERFVNEMGHRLMAGFDPSTGTARVWCSEWNDPLRIKDGHLEDDRHVLLADEHRWLSERWKAWTGKTFESPCIGIYKPTP